MTVRIDSVNFCRESGKSVDVRISDGGKTDIIHGVNEVHIDGEARDIASCGIVCFNRYSYAVGIKSDGRKVLMVGE